MTDCPFCLQNNSFKGDILAQNDHALLARNHYVPDTYLIIPKTHVESLLDLPDDWWHDMKAMLAALDLSGSYNLSLNMGKEAGQSLKHLHFWIIPRPAGQAASGKGLARLINDANQE